MSQTEAREGLDQSTAEGQEQEAGKRGKDQVEARGNGLKRVEQGEEGQGKGGEDYRENSRRRSDQSMEGDRRTRGCQGQARSSREQRMNKEGGPAQSQERETAT